MASIFLGIDVGTSSIKAALLDAETGRHVAIASSPEKELPILSPKPGFAEQDPQTWWEHTVLAVRMLPSELLAQVQAIGIGYQMHGLVLVDEEGHPTRSSIIWCDSRAAEIGDRALRELGDYCFRRLLNSPGNFTASKLRWMVENDPETLRNSQWAMLPGDYVAMRMTGRPLTTNSGLSEMALWDFPLRDLSRDLLSYFEIPERLIPEHVPTFGKQGAINDDIAGLLGVPQGVEVTFRAGDQPMNALALSVMHPGEVAATAGTSGVIYSVTDQPHADPEQRVNTFLHVNADSSEAAYGVLCCINGCGSLLSWLRNQVLEGSRTYEEMNALGAQAPAGADGLLIYPFGNGAERVLGNANPGAHLVGVDFSRHGLSHLCRAAQEAVAFAMYYGVESLPRPQVIRASNANLFLSPLFAQMVADLNGAVVEIHDTQGVYGAAWGAAIGYGAAHAPRFAGVARRFEPQSSGICEAYEEWKMGLPMLPRNSRRSRGQGG